MVKYCGFLQHNALLGTPTPRAVSSGNLESGIGSDCSVDWPWTLGGTSGLSCGLWFY